MAGGIDVRAAGGGSGEAQRVVDHAGGHLGVAHQPGQDRQPGGVGARPAVRPQRVRRQVPDRARAGPPAPSWCGGRPTARRACRGRGRRSAGGGRCQPRSAAAWGSGSRRGRTARRSRSALSRAAVSRTRCCRGCRSRCRSRSPGAGRCRGPILAISVSESEATGSADMSWFQTLPAGNAGQAGADESGAARARRRRPDEAGRDQRRLRLQQGSTESHDDRLRGLRPPPRPPTGCHR